MKKVRYRIKVITYGSGRKEYFPAVKKLLWWTGLDYEGNTSVNYARDSREDALGCIDHHYAGNSRVHSIEFEYINK